MKLFALIFAVILATAQAAQVKSFTAINCGGTIDFEKTTANAVEIADADCVKVADALFYKVTCSDDTTDATWSLTSFSNAACTTVVDTATDTTDDCQDTEEILDGSSLSVDCSKVPSSCFSGNDFVMLESGKKVPYGDLKVGDRVLSIDEDGNLFYDRVFRLSSWHPKQRHTYLKITSATGFSLEIDENHFIHANDCCSLDNMKVAGKVAVGDKIYVVGENGLTADEVTKVENVEATGVFNAHTLNGNIVVNGVAASHFTTETLWHRRSWAPYWYKVVDLAARVTGSA